MILKMINKSVVKILIVTINIYQYFLSPLLKTNCRYLPSCSEYSILALKKHGAIIGGFYSIKRIFSCHPFGGKGYDPVPKKINEKVIK
mgnify:CR=1 FL=1|tara:strand:- start:5387 stop:5650 length:264 start_codon:yes stop_codon:yes gene_type:complete